MSKEDKEQIRLEGELQRYRDHLKRPEQEEIRIQKDTIKQLRIALRAKDVINNRLTHALEGVKQLANDPSLTPCTALERAKQIALNATWQP